MLPQSLLSSWRWKKFDLNETLLTLLYSDGKENGSSSIDLLLNSDFLYTIRQSHPTLPSAPRQSRPRNSESDRRKLLMHKVIARRVSAFESCP